MGKVEAEIAGGHRDRTGRITFQPPLLTDNVASLFPSLHRDIIHPTSVNFITILRRGFLTYLLTYLLAREKGMNLSLKGRLLAPDKRQARLKLRNEKRRECY